MSMKIQSIFPIVDMEVIPLPTKEPPCLSILNPSTEFLDLYKKKETEIDKKIFKIIILLLLNK